MKQAQLTLTFTALRRLREIAAGDSQAKNTPDEDVLLKRHLIKESMLVLDNGNGMFSTDVRGVLLTAQGEKYLTQHLKERKETRRFWIEAVLAIIGIIVAVLGIVIPFIASATK